MRFAQVTGQKYDLKYDLTQVSHSYHNIRFDKNLDRILDNKKKGRHRTQ